MHFTKPIINVIKFLFILLLISGNLQAQFVKDNLIRKAQEDILNNKYTTAIQTLNDELEMNPDNHLAYYLRGLAKRELGDKMGAFNDFSTTIYLHPGFSKAYYFRSLLKLDYKDFYNAMADINKALNYNVTNSNYYVARGYIYNVLNDTINALHDFNTAIFLDGENGNAYLNKSLLELDQKQYDKAMHSINKCIAISSFNPNQFIIRAYIELNKTDSNAAKSDYEFVISKDSTCILAYYNLGLYYYSKLDYEKTLSYFNKVLELNPYHSECYYNRAALYAGKSNYVEAINDYNHVIKINPLNINAYFNRAYVKQFISDYSSALIDLNKVIELYPKFQKAYLLRSNIYTQLYNFKAADHDRKFANILLNARNDSTSFNKSDSLYLLPLIDFRSESEAMDTSQGHIQYKSFKIMQKNNYSLIPDNDNNLFKNFNEHVDVLNQNKFINLKLRIDNIDSKLSYANIAESKTLLDSLSTGNNVLKETNNLWKCVLSGLLKNYYEALQPASQVSDTSKYFYLSSFLKGNIYIEMGEQEEENLNMNNLIESAKISNENNDNYNHAIEEFTNSIVKNGKFSFAYYNRAYAKCQINDISGAIIDYSSCIFFDNANGDAHYNRGLLYILTGDIANACTDFSKAGELGVSEAYSLMYKYCKQ